MNLATRVGLDGVYIIMYTMNVARWKTVAHRKFSKWLNGLDEPQRDIIEARLKRIREEGEFGSKGHLGGGLYELRWTSGWRVYYSYCIDDDGRLIVLYWGGMKNGQKRDIEKARKLQRNYC